MAPRVLGEQDLNRALLARQLLLRRAALPLPSAVERLGGLQTQYAPSPYIGLWSRLSGFARDDLTRALEGRRIVQGTLMRVTIHMVSRRDYHPMVEGVRLRRREWWLRTHRGAGEAPVAAVAARVRDALAGGRVARRDELLDLVGGDAALWNGVGLWVDLVRVPPSGTWDQRRADLYALAEDWVGPGAATPEQGAALLLRRYLAAFGPAPLRDAAAWAGVPVGALAPAAAGMRLRRLRDTAGQELLDLPRGPLPRPGEPAPVRFLPTWDACLLAHARRTGVLPEEHRPRVFGTRTPQSVPTFLVDGRVAGAWRPVRGQVVLEPFAPLPAAAVAELEDEAHRLTAFMASSR